MLNQRWAWLFFVAIWLGAGSSNVGETSHSSFLPNRVWDRARMAELQSGDIIFRRGTDQISEMVLHIDDRPLYSHVGVVVMLDGNPMVVHASPAEEVGERDEVKIESVLRFLAPDRAADMAVYRLRGGSDAANAVTRVVVDEALAFVSAHTRFDHSFDLETSDSLYCTELVWRVFRKAGIELASNPPKARILWWSGTYLPPSLIQTSAQIERVCC